MCYFVVLDTSVVINLFDTLYMFCTLLWTLLDNRSKVTVMELKGMGFNTFW